MKTTLLAAAALAALVATPAFAQDGAGYIQVNVGASVAGDVDLELSDSVDTVSGETDLETGIFASIAAGSTISAGFSAEFEVLYLNSDIDTDEIDDALGAPLNAKVTSYAAMANAIYSFNAGSFTPYVGAGVGYGSSEYELDGASEDDAGIAWQLRAGVTFPMSDSVTWDIGYRYLNTPGFEVTEGLNSIEADASAHIVTVGARFSF